MVQESKDLIKLVNQVDSLLKSITNSEQSTKRPPTTETCFLDVVLICNKFQQNKDIHGFSFSLIQVGVLVMRQS